MAIQKGDQVTLKVANNGTKAFQVLTPGRVYTVEGTGNGCRATPNTPQHGLETVKIMGTYFCAEAFQAVGVQPAARAGSSGVSGRREDPARSLYVGETDYYDTLPDVNPREGLPTYEELEDKWWRDHGYPNGRPSNNLP